MALRYRKRTRIGSNTYHTVSRSSRGTNSSTTTKSGAVTSTQNKYGSRVTLNHGGGVTSTSYIKNAFSQMKEQQRKKQRKKHKLINPVYLIPVLLLTGIFDKLDGTVTTGNQTFVSKSDSSENTIHAAANSSDKNLVDDLSRITAQNDLNYIKLSLASAFHLGAKAKFVYWYNPENHHEGTVALNAEAQINANCRQFTITRTDSQHSAISDKANATTTYCADGTLQ